MGVTPNLSRRGPASEPFAVTRVAELHIIAFDGGRELPDLCAMASTIHSRYGLSVALGGLGKQVKQKRPLSEPARICNQAVGMFDELSAVEVLKADVS